MPEEAALEDSQVVIGRVGRPHGIRGEVTVEVRTDDPDGRFAPGATIITSPAHVGPLTVQTTHWHSGRLLVAFAGVADRSAAEALRDTLLVVHVDPAQRPAHPDEYYDHQLVGLAVRTTDGVDVGTVGEVLHLPAQDVLAVHRADGREALVPFMTVFVPLVDLDERVVVIDPPPGLLDDSAED